MKKNPIRQKALALFLSISFVADMMFNLPAAAASQNFSSTAVTAGTSADCVVYNLDTHWAYILDQQTGTIDIMKPSGGSFVPDASASIHLTNLLQHVPGLSSGTATSLAVDTLRDVIAISVKSANDMKPGGIILTDYAGNFIKEFPAGVQPDGIFVSPDQEYILTADKGEATAAGDPKGSVTVLDLGRGITEASSKVVSFDKFAGDQDVFMRTGGILKDGTSLPVDLEPTSLCVAGGNAYVTCEKNNAIATLNLSTDTFTAIAGLGYKDSSLPVDVLTNSSNNGAYSDSGYFGTSSAYMPNGIAAFTERGTTYLVTANEGANDELNAQQGIDHVSVQALTQNPIKSGDGKQHTINSDDYEDVQILQNNYTMHAPCNHVQLGTRSVSVWNAATMQQVGDTEGQLETALHGTEAYNRSTDAGTKPDAWSCRNGSAPDTVSIAESGGVPYAYVGLRAGGVAAFNLSDTAHPSFDTFANTRSNADACSSDSLALVPAVDSPSGSTLLLQTSGPSGKLYIAKEGQNVSTDRTLDIFCTNDMHGSLVTAKNSAGAVQTIGSDYVAGLKRDDPGSLLLDAGDATQGTSLATLTQGADVIRLMNAAGYDAMACGNHEFDYGQAQLLSNAQAAEFPILSANSMKNGNPFFQGISYLGGAKTNNGSYVIKYAKGLKIGILGITTPETALKTNPNGTQGISFGPNDSSFYQIVQNQIQSLKTAENPDVIVGVMHVGNDLSSTVTAKGIIQNTRGLNLLVDGHSHQVESENLLDGSGQSVPLVQTGSHSSQVDQVTLHYNAATHAVTCNPTTDITAFSGRNISNTQPVASVTQMASDIVAAQADKLKPVVGSTKTTLWGGTVSGINEARLGETNLGCLIADAMTWKAKQLIPSTDQNMPIVALENGGGVRATMQAGNITIGDVLNVLPFGNTVAFKQVTPAQLYDIMENGVSQVVSQDASTGQITSGDGRFPQISGFRFTYDPRGTAYSFTNHVAGTRVSSITLNNGTKLDRSDTSTKLVLVSNDFEIAGGDGYDILKGLPSVGEGGGLDTVLEDYIQSLGGTVNMPVSSNRVVCEGVYTPKSYTASVTVQLNHSTVKNTTVNYQIDGGSILSAVTDENGVAKLSNLSDGPHTVKIGDADDILVNNYSGAGTASIVTAQTQTTVQIAGGYTPSPSPSPTVPENPQPVVVVDHQSNTTVNLGTATLPAGVTSVTLQSERRPATGSSDYQTESAYTAANTNPALSIIGTPIVYHWDLLDQNKNHIDCQGNVTVSVPVPSGLRGTPKVFLYDAATGKMIDMHAVVKNNTLQFSTAKFGNFVIAGTGDAITLDTVSYQMPTRGGHYEIGAKLAGTKANHVKVTSTNPTIATVAKLKDGNYQVNGRGSGTVYIMFDVYDAENRFLTHASVRIDVKAGIHPKGDSTRQYGLY